jgi:uncharacterized protein YneF (UPF0154 family)
MFSILVVLSLIVFFLGGIFFYRKHQAKIEEAAKAVEATANAVKSKL